MTAAFLAPLAAVAQTAAHAAGTNVVDSSGTVWMVMPNGTRRAYTSAGAFLSYGFNSWASVVPANAADLALSTGSFIPPQDGSLICSNKGSDVGTCYEISGGMKYGFTSAAVFTGLGFSFSNTLAGDVSFLTMGSQLINSATMAHLPGTLVNNAGTVQLVGSTGVLGIPDLATFNSWGYSFTKVVPANAADKAMTQTGVMAARTPGQLSPTGLASTGTTTGTGTTTVVSGNVSATLSSDTPAAGTLVSNTVSANAPGQTGADVANFTFSGTGTVTQVVVNRIGVSADTSISNVYLYQGNNRITSAGSFSNGVVTFSNSSGLFTVSGSMEISVRIDVAAGATSGQTVGAQLASYTVANGNPMSTSISGNLFQLAGVNNLATAQLSVSKISGSNPVTSSGASNGCLSNNCTINAGTSNAILWQTPINIGQRTVLLKHVAFTQIGSIQSSAITNYQLYVDGSAVSVTPTLTNAGGQTQVVFDMPSNPVSLGTGSHTVALEGNIVGGTSFTFEYSLQTAADIVLFDTNYNVNVPLTYSDYGSVFQLNPGLTTISSGTVSVQTDPSFTATQFVTNQSQITLGQWDLTAYGENVNVNQLEVQIRYQGQPTTSLEGFNNLSMYVNGGSVGSSQGALAGSGTSCSAGSGFTACYMYTFGTTNLFSISAGQTVTLQVKGDNVLGSPTNVTGVQATLVIPVQTIQGQTSYALSPTQFQGAQSYSANTLTTGTSSATLAKNTSYTNQTIGSNVTNQEIGSYTIQASSIDGLRLNQVTVGIYGTLNNSPTTGMTNLSVQVVYPGGSASTTPVNPQASNTFTLNNVTIPANQTATVNVFANIGNFTGTASTTMSGTGQGLTSNQSVYLNQSGASNGLAVIGQNMYINNGTLASGSPILQTSSPVASFVIGGSSNQPAATFNFVASTGGVTIQELDFNASSTVSGAITSVTVGGVTAPVVGASSTVTGLNIAVPTNYSGIDVPVTVNYSQVGLNGVNSNAKVQLVLSRVKYLSGSSTQYDPSSPAGSYGSLVSSNMFDLVGSAPTVTLTASGNTLTAGATIGSITISANAGGNIIASTVPLSISTNNATITGTLSLIDASTGQTAGSVTGLTVGSGSSATTTVQLTADNNIAAGTSKTYNIVLPAGLSIVASANNYSVTVGMGGAQYFLFNDVNGGSTYGINIPGASGGNTFIVNYPTNTVTSHQ